MTIQKIIQVLLNPNKTVAIKYLDFKIKDLEYKFLRLKSKCGIGYSIFNLISLKF